MASRPMGSRGWAAQQGGMRDEPPPPRRRRSYLGVFLGAVTGIALCALALGVLVLTHGQAQAPAPDATGQAICADLAAQKYTDLYGLLDGNLQGAGTADQFALSQEQLDAMAGKVTACSSRIASQQGGQATLALTVTRGGTAGSQGAVRLIVVNGAWKIDAYDTSVI